MASNPVQRKWQPAWLLEVVEAVVLAAVVETVSGSRVTFWVLQLLPVQHLMLQSIRVQFCNEAKRFLASSQAACVPKVMKSKVKKRNCVLYIVDLQ